jgi:predicted amidohydrolase YtcJ
LPPDTILVNGKIVTMDSQNSIVEAVAVRSGRIVAIGSTESIESLAGDDTRRIDLAGRTATPGLIDSHNHFAVSAADALYSLDLAYPNVKTITDIVERVRERAAARGPGEWVTGGRWDEGKLKENRHIHAEDLDPVSPDNPVWLTHTTSHYGVANSRALKLAGITQETPDPPGGLIDRYSDGTPTGILKDTAMSLIWPLVPDQSVEQLQTAIQHYLPELNKEGITAIKDPEIGLGIWEAYQRVLQEGKLTARVFVLWRAGRTLEEAHELIERVGPFSKPWISTGDDLLISGGVKLYADGSGGARTAWVYDEWNKNLDEIDRGNYGVPRVEPSVLRQEIQAFHDAGLHIGVHAVGDRAIDWVVDSYAEALEAKPSRGLRHSIIHCNIPTDHAMDRMAKLQSTYDAGYPEVQPSFLWWIGDTYAGNFGPARNRRVLPLKAYLERGIRWGGGSDYDVTPFPARYGLWASSARETVMGVYGSHPFGMEQSIDIESALRAYTTWNARQLFLEDEIGSIEVGKYADIAVWDKDLLSVPVDEIKELRAELTLMNGKIVHQAPDSPIAVTTGGEPGGSGVRVQFSHQ